MAQIDPNTIQWDASPQTVGEPATGAMDKPLRGGVIIPPAPEKAPAPPSGYERTPTGGLTYIPGGPDDPAVIARNVKVKQEAEVGGGKPTEAQQKAATLVTRIAGGFQDIENVISKSPESQSPGLVETFRGGLAPTGILAPVTRSIAGADRRIVYDAQRDVLDALLTLSTGAAYSPEQLEAQMGGYFPQYGDTEKEINFKNNRMRRLIESARENAGPLAPKIDEILKKFEMSSAPQAGGEGPNVIVTPEQSIAAFGELTYDEKGNLVGANYSGMAYNADGTERGLVGSVSDETLNQPAPSFYESAINAVTGEGQATPTTERLPDWVEMPGINNLLSSAAWKTGLGTAFGGSPQEIAQIVQDNFPGTQVYQDEKGNYILRSAVDGKDYAIKPGFQVSDIPRAGNILGLGILTGGRTPLGIAGREAAAQTGIETVQSGTGGTFNPADIAIAGAMGGTIGKVAQAVPNVVRGVRNFRSGGDVPPGGGGGGASSMGEAPSLPGGIALPGGRVSPPPAGGAPMGGAPEGGAAPMAPAPTGGAPEANVGAMAGGAMPEATSPEAAAEVGTIIRDAIGTDKKAKISQIKLAEMAQVNPEAMAAAQRLGLDIPADVFSDSAQIRAAVGLTRSLAGSEAEASWRNTVSKAVDDADNVMRNFDAQFVEGAVSPGTVSNRVKESLTNTRSSLAAQAKKIYEQVDAAVPLETPVNMRNLSTTLDEIKREVGTGGMKAPEVRLLRMIGNKEPITYGRLIREKNLIGKALKREESPYGSLDEATLKRLYAALASDQLDNVEAIAGPEMRSQLRGANLIYAKERALGQRIVKAFGDDLEGGIAGKMRSAITEASKGDPGQFTRLMKSVPEDLRREVVATAITAATRSGRGAERGGFGFSEFADLYPKLRANPPIYKQIVEALGKDASETLRDLYVVSKRITEARANVLTTGKANQAMLASINAESLVSRIMDSTTAKRAVGAAMGGLGPIAGAVMPDVMAAMTKGKPDAVRAAGKLFISPEFQEMLVSAAGRSQVSERSLNKVARSKGFLSFAKAIGLDPKDGKEWLRSTVENKDAQ